MRVLIILVVPLLFVSCSLNNITEDESLETYFSENNVNGCFALFDNGTGRFTIYDLARYRDSAYLPASTFKIINSLIGIETGIITDSATVISWDSVVRSVPEWNRDLSMAQAFRWSAVPWYRELARRTGRDTMQRWLDTLGYASQNGKVVIQDNLDTFWLDNSVKITADEQLGLVKKLYFDQLPFQPRTQRIVKSMMLREDNANYRLSYKTGWGRLENGQEVGWLVGWVEENNHPYFFVLQLISSDAAVNMAVLRENILKKILTHLGFLEGRR